MNDAAPDVLVEPIVRSALAEDWGRVGDVTSYRVIPPNAHGQFLVVAREHGVLSGSQPARLAFLLTDQNLQWLPLAHDSDPLTPGQPVARVQGPAVSILSAERVALNFLGLLCGVATAASQLLLAARSSNPLINVSCTRKTTPNLRILEKLAVKHGGGVNHRFGLDDAILIKDNHIAVAGNIAVAVARAKNPPSHTLRIQAEADNQQIALEAARAGADSVLLDNMSPNEVAALVPELLRVNPDVFVEVSGGITVKNAPDYARSGAHLLSCGALTHSSPALNVALDAETPT